MTPRLSETQTGLQPALLTWIVSVSTPIILGIEGPQMSVSIMPTVESGFAAKACESNDENVDLPTPPFPDNTSILCRMPARRDVMRGMSGSGPFGAEAHIDWFGQPWQASPCPACSDSGPGQCSGNDQLRTTASMRERAYLVPERLAAAQLSVAFREQSERRLRNYPDMAT